MARYGYERKLTNLIKRLALVALLASIWQNTGVEVEIAK